MPVHIPLILAGILAVAAPDSGVLDSMPGMSAPSDQSDQDVVTPGDRGGHGLDDSLGGDENGGGSGGSRQVQLTDTELFSAMAGNIVGAASLCKDIDKDRVTTATDGVSAVVVATSSDKKEQNLSKLLFMHNIGGGRQAVRAGEVDCKTVDDSLSKLQQFSARLVNNSTTGGSE